MTKEKKKKIAIHQPNFLPWMGYFHKMQQVDQFVYLDHVAFSKGSYTNRAKIHLPPDQETWMTVPLKHFSLGTPINEIQIDRSQDFESRMLYQLENAYSDSPNFDKSIAFVQEVFDEFHTIDILSTFNIAWIDKIVKQLGFTMDFELSSSLHVEGQKDDLLLSICEELEAEEYVSGMGGKNYMDAEAFAQKGINIQFNDFISWQKSQENYGTADLVGKSVLSWMFLQS